jgi:hypothetical protein
MKGHMRKSQSQIKLIANNSVPLTKITDTAGNPSESYDWEHLALVRQEWQNEFWQPQVNAFEPTLIEITGTETWVRKAFYPENG